MNGLIGTVTAELRRRPWWMNLIWGYCVVWTVIFLPADVFLEPVQDAEDVWFGYRFHDWPAKTSAVVHWFVYGAGAYGFWRMSRWMWPWAALYFGQVAIAMLVWNLAYEGFFGGGIVPGAISAALFVVPTVALWRVKPLFRGNEVAG